MNLSGSTAFAWLWENRQWLFSGVGVALLAGLFAFWKSRNQADRASGALSDEDSPFLEIEEQPAPKLIWTIVEKIPGLEMVAMRHTVTEQQIAKRIRVSVSGEGDGMSFWKFDSHGRLNARLDFVNFNPFPIVMDRITGDATVGGMPVAQLKILDRYNIPAHSAQDIPLEVELSAAQIGQIEFQLKQRSDAPTGMNLKIYLETPVRNATLQRQLATGNRRFLNF